MSYIGSSTSNMFDATRSISMPANQDTFSGDGATTVFTLSRSVFASVDIDVLVANVRQTPTESYAASGTTLTFTAAPASGTNNIYVVYRLMQSALTPVYVPDASISSNKLVQNIRMLITDHYIANGSVNSFGLSETPLNANTLFVSVNGVVKYSPMDYSISSDTITFVTTPSSTANVRIVHLGMRTAATPYNVPPDSTITRPNLASPTLTGTISLSDMTANTMPVLSSSKTLAGVAPGTSGNVLVSNGTNWQASTISTTSLADSSVTPAKGGTGQNFSTTAQGSTLYFSGTGTVAALAPGTSGQFLKTQGAGANPAWDTVTTPAAATQAELEAASSTTVFTSPGRERYHPTASKAWGNGDKNGNVLISFNVSSLTDIATGRCRWNWTTAFTSGSYGIQMTLNWVGIDTLFTSPTGEAGSSCEQQSRDEPTFLVDPSNYYVAIHGDHP